MGFSPNDPIIIEETAVPISIDRVVFEQETPFMFEVQDNTTRRKEPDEQERFCIKVHWGNLSVDVLYGEQRPSRLGYPFATAEQAFQTCAEIMHQVKEGAYSIDFGLRHRFDLLVNAYDGTPIPPC